MAIIEDSGEERFANGQNSRDLRAGSDAGELETQLMEAIDSIGDFLRFVYRSAKSEISSRNSSRRAVIGTRPAGSRLGCGRTNDARRCLGAEASQ